MIWKYIFYLIRLQWPIGNLVIIRVGSSLYYMAPSGMVGSTVKFSSHSSPCFRAAAAVSCVRPRTSCLTSQCRTSLSSSSCVQSVTRGSTGRKKLSTKEVLELELKVAERKSSGLFRSQLWDAMHCSVVGACDAQNRYMTSRGWEGSIPI